MTPWDTFLALCDRLRAGLFGGAPRLDVAAVGWESLIKVSSQHCVTPALAWCLRHETGLPPEVAAFFHATLSLNARRNAKLLAALEQIIGILNAAEIEPVLLKGAARLVDGIYPAQSLRFLGDLDLLILPAQLAKASTALRDVGFLPRPGDPLEDSHHHLPMLYDPASGAGVELHRHLAMPPFDAIAATPWFLDGALAVQRRGLRFRLPDATRVLAHAVVHDQLVHHQYRWFGTELRQLLDGALVMSRWGHEIDWNVLDRRFDAAGAGAVLPTYMHFATMLFDQPAPTLMHAPRPGAMRKFERRSGAWQTVGRIAHDYLLAPRTGRWDFLRMLAPQTFAHRLRRVMTALDIEV